MKDESRVRSPKIFREDRQTTFEGFERCRMRRSGSQAPEHLTFLGLAFNVFSCCDEVCDQGFPVVSGNFGAVSAAIGLDKGSYSRYCGAEKI